MIPQRVKRLSVWLRRAHHSRGFGVQSPSAYSFVRYVINEHYPYYSYDLLAAQFKDVDSLTLKKRKAFVQGQQLCSGPILGEPKSSVFCLFGVCARHAFRVRLFRSIISRKSMPDRIGACRFLSFVFRFEREHDSGGDWTGEWKYNSARWFIAKVWRATILGICSRQREAWAWPLICIMSELFFWQEK